MPYFVYLLECKDHSFYCGYTKDIKRRAEEHGKGIGSKYTRARRPVKLIYVEEQPTLSAALKREHAIKKFSRKQKEELVKISLHKLHLHPLLLQMQLGKHSHQGIDKALDTKRIACTGSHQLNPN